MPPRLARPPLPSDDKRWRVVEAAMRRQGYASHALIEALHAVQESFGFLDDVSLRWVAASLHVPPSRVMGVATFYHHFSLKPQGEHTCVVCTGTACYIKGSPAILTAVEAEYGVKVGETTPDGKLSLLAARCLGTCGLAPAVVLDGQVHGNMAPARALGAVGEMVGHDA